MTTPALAVEAKAYGMASVSLDQPVLAGKAMETLVAIASDTALAIQQSRKHI